MCQILKGPSAQLKSVLLTTSGLLEELHKNNPDGWGALYHDGSAPVAIKALPKDANDTRKLIADLPDDNRDVALHWRWKTSGLVDQENAHPHFVDGGWLIHNGILDVDCSADKDRCDTHHFARQYLDGSMQLLVQSPRMLGLLGEFIGNNRFVLMCDSGVMVAVNKQQGYTAQGIWFANEYSMSRYLVDPTRTKPVPRTYKRWEGDRSYTNNIKEWGMDGGTAWESDFDLDAWDHKSLDVYEDDEEYDFAAELDQCIMDYDTEVLAEHLENFPSETLGYIFSTYAITEYRKAATADMTLAYKTMQALLIAGDIHTLVDLIDDDMKGHVPKNMAETLLYFCCVDELVEVTV